MNAAMRRIIPAVLIFCLAIVPLPGRAQQQAPPPPQQQQPASQQEQPPPPAPPSPQPQPPQQQRRVRAIVVRGNTHIPTEQILAAVTHTKVGDPLADDKLRDDLRAIVDLGWFVDASVRLENEDDGVRVVFLVIENPIVAEIIVEGNTAVSTDEIRRALGVPVGEVLNIKRMSEGARAVQKLYEDRGVVLARVQDIGMIPTEGANDRGRLRVRIAEGTVEAVRFEGLRKTRERTARRHLLIKPGDVFNINTLNRDLQRLFDLGLFESIRARPEPGSTPDSAVIVIEVREARTAQVTGGVGYSTAEGVLGFIEYRDRNWRGLGQTAVLRTDRSVQAASAGRFNYELSFSEPFLDAQRTSLDLSLYQRTTEDREFSGSTVLSRFETQRMGSLMTLTRPLDPLTVGSLRLRSERTSITPLPIDPNNPSSPVVSPSAGFIDPLCTSATGCRVVSFQFAGTRDTRNDRLNPIRGSKISLVTEFGLRALGGQFGFGKYSAEVQQYFPLGANSTVLARVFAGISSGTLPSQEQFLLGGPSTVRALRASQFRGVNMYVANLEYQFPLGNIIRRLGDTKGIVFVDAGVIPQVTSVQVGYGIGVALQTPLGPIRIDIAFGQQGTQTWLSLGSPFN